jgi:predicted DNA-binding protein
MKHRKISEQQEKDIQEIVDYYMQFVTGEYHSIRESIEYYWQCMSDYTIEDYLEIVRQRKAQNK